VNAYRRLDPHFEAPNQINASAVDRGAMIRVPIGNSKSMRVEVRSVAPDANPYLVLYTVFKTGIDGDTSKIANLRQAERYLADNIYTAIEDFRKAEWTTKLLGADVKGRYADLKQSSADRCARLLGTVVKGPGGAVSPRGLQPVSCGTSSEGWPSRQTRPSDAKAKNKTARS
jgi:glutamine synthetase